MKKLIIPYSTVWTGWRKDWQTEDICLDVRLYVTLARFDVAYHNIFRVNKKRLRDYDNLWAYARDLYQTPGFGNATDFAAIKKHYHIDCNPGNIHQIIAKGSDEEAWLLLHRREKLSENKI